MKRFDPISSVTSDGISKRKDGMGPVNSFLATAINAKDCKDASSPGNCPVKRFVSSRRRSARKHTSKQHTLDCLGQENPISHIP